MTKENIIEVAKAIQQANEAAIEAGAANREDGGTCNMDTLLIDFTGWKKADIDEVSALSGVRIGDKLNGFHAGCRFIWTKTDGQANLRSRMVEAAYKSLKYQGIEAASIWYQMD